MVVIKTWEIPGVTVPKPNERTLKVIFSPEVNNKNFIMLLSLIYPQGSTGLHTHEVDEYMYVVSGHGKAFCEGEEETEIHPDTIVYAPAGKKHEIRNTGDETIKLVCVYVPAFKTSGYLKEAEAKAKEFFSSK